MRDESLDKGLVLCTLERMDALTAAQLRRVLQDVGLSDDFDLVMALAQFVQEGLVRQSVALSGVVYSVTPEGIAAQRAMQVPEEKRNEIAAKAESFQAIFTNEENYLAQYTEQANAIVPVFLSIRKDEKVLFKVSIIVNDVETAVKIKDNWMKNAQKTYEAVWACIGEGEPFPSF